MKIQYDIISEKWDVLNFDILNLYFSVHHLSLYLLLARWCVRSWNIKISNVKKRHNLKAILRSSPDLRPLWYSLYREVYLRPFYYLSRPSTFSNSQILVFYYKIRVPQQLRTQESKAAKKYQTSIKQVFAQQSMTNIFNYMRNSIPILSWSTRLRSYVFFRNVWPYCFVVPRTWFCSFSLSMCNCWTIIFSWLILHSTICFFVKS